MDHPLSYLGSIVLQAWVVMARFRERRPGYHCIERCAVPQPGREQSG